MNQNELIKYNPETFKDIEVGDGLETDESSLDNFPNEEKVDDAGQII